MGLLSPASYVLVLRVCDLINYCCSELRLTRLGYQFQQSLGSNNQYIRVKNVSPLNPKMGMRLILILCRVYVCQVVCLVVCLVVCSVMFVSRTYCVCDSDHAILKQAPWKMYISVHYNCLLYLTTCLVEQVAVTVT